MRTQVVVMRISAELGEAELAAGPESAAPSEGVQIESGEPVEIASLCKICNKLVHPVCKELGCGKSPGGLDITRQRPRML